MVIDIGRREFISVLAGAAAASLLRQRIARAQRPFKLGMLYTGGVDTFFTMAFMRKLGELGYAEGTSAASMRVSLPAGSVRPSPAAWPAQREEKSPEPWASAFARNGMIAPAASGNCGASAVIGPTSRMSRLTARAGRPVITTIVVSSRADFRAARCGAEIHWLRVAENLRGSHACWPERATRKLAYRVFLPAQLARVPSRFCPALRARGDCGYPKPVLPCRLVTVHSLTLSSGLPGTTANNSVGIRLVILRGQVQIWLTKLGAD